MTGPDLHIEVQLIVTLLSTSYRVRYRKPSSGRLMAHDFPKRDNASAEMDGNAVHGLCLARSQR